MAGLQDEAEKSNEHLERVSKILEEIREGSIGKAATLGGRAAVDFFAGREGKEKSILDDPKVQVLITALRFLADKATNQVEAMAKLEAALSLQARATVREQVGDIGAALARAGHPAPPEFFERLTAQLLAQEQAAMVGRREALGIAERTFVGIRGGMSQEEADRIARDASEQGFVSQQVAR